MNKDTICAIATGHGGALGIVRVSGDKARQITDSIFKAANKHSLMAAKGNTLVYGQIVEANGETIDDVLVSVFKTPHSYTGENATEISCHNSPYILQRIMLRLVENGARLADHGEYTQRAFLNGKMDLSQAEAVADLISSSSAASHRLAIKQMRGGLTKEFKLLREKLLHLTSLMELELDFNDHEDLEFADRKQLSDLLNEIKCKMKRLADSFHYGNAIKNGIPVAIVGDTNAGKSTLLNTLLGEEKAIVSEIKGTTRDAIEDTINIGGILFRFIDTAGIRKTNDSIEQMGIQRSFEKMEQAAIVLWMIDCTQIENSGFPLPQNLEDQTDKQIVLVFNKIDAISNDKLTRLQNEAKGLSNKSIFISAKQKERTEDLNNLLLKLAEIPTPSEDEFVVTNLRHFKALQSAIECSERSQKALQNDVPTDLVAEDLRECLRHLSEIVGEVTTTEVLHSIFQHFCIGK